MSNQHDYTKLDAAIIAAINGAPPAQFFRISNDAQVQREAETLASAEFEKAEAWRIMDRRLQSMRKAGRIKYQRKSKDKKEGWVIA